MARSAKGARGIVVNDVAYRWRTKFTDDGLSLSVWPDGGGTMVICRFGLAAVATHMPNGDTNYAQFLVVTPRIVQRVVEHALKHAAYDPMKNEPTVAISPSDIELSDAVRTD